MTLEKRKSRGDVAAGKVQVNWRILSENVDVCAKDAEALGLGSPPAFVNYILSMYRRGQTINRAKLLKKKE
jgi:hypothetical protein